MELVSVNRMNLEWPGWPTSENKFGEEFDLPARERMVKGSYALIDFLNEFLELFDGPFLEIGPFFNPLMENILLNKPQMRSSDVFYLENDSHAVAWLESLKLSKVIPIDLNHVNFEKMFNEFLFADESPRAYFDSIIVSQVLNYVNFKRVLSHLYSIVKPNGLLFINNVVDFGIPELFSIDRPKSDMEIIGYSEQIGFGIEVCKVIEKQFDKQPYDRLILVLRKLN